MTEETMIPEVADRVREQADYDKGYAERKYKLGDVLFLPVVLTDVRDSGNLCFEVKGNPESHGRLSKRTLFELEHYGHMPAPAVSPVVVEPVPVEPDPVEPDPVEPVPVEPVPVEPAVVVKPKNGKAKADVQTA